MSQVWSKSYGKVISSTSVHKQLCIRGVAYTSVPMHWPKQAIVISKHQQVLVVKDSDNDGIPYRQPANLELSAMQVTVIFLVDVDKCLPSSADWLHVWAEQQAWKQAKKGHEDEQVSSLLPPATQRCPRGTLPSCSSTLPCSKSCTQGAADVVASC